MKKIAILLVTLALLQTVQSAFAIPPDSKDLLEDLPGVTFTMGGSSAQINCQVFQFTSGDNSGGYLYTYQITNNSAVGLSFFSVGVTGGAVINVVGSDPGIDTANPLQWTSVIDADTSLFQSVEALFDLPVKNTQTSALLWFVSDQGPVLGEGFLFGTLAGVPQYDSEELFAPVPEPATISLLVFGGILAARARRRNSV